MIGNANSKVKNCNESDALALTFYLYQIASNIEDLESHEEMQVLYNALVDRLKLDDHVKKIMGIMLNKQIKNKSLTLNSVSSKYQHPFDYKGKLKQNFREDEMAYDNCGRWSTKDRRNINLIRLLFSRGRIDFSKLIAMTFFVKPESIDENCMKIPSAVKIPENVKKACNDLSSIEFAIETLKLSKDEGELLLLVFRLQNIREMYNVCNDLFRNDNYSRLEIYSKCSLKSCGEIRKLLKNDGKLQAFGLIDSSGDMDEDAIDAISERDMKYYFTDIIKSVKEQKVYALDSFSTKKEKTDITLQLLKSESPCNILIYGAPGSGKTEFARALVKQAGLKAVSYKNELEVKDNDSVTAEKAVSRLNCYLSLKRDDTILIVDEAESVLQTRTFSFFGRTSSSKKGTVNTMLENSENKVIWIVNYTDEMDESTLRRFTYSIKFNEMPESTLRNITKDKLRNLKIKSQLKEEILDLCGNYKVTGASVENVVKAIRAMDYEKKADSEIIRDIASVLEANSTLLYGKKKIRNTVKNNYDLSILNTSTPSDELVGMVEAAVSNNQDEYRIEGGLRMLFYGLSGTGKTELARYISEKLKRPLLLKRCSDLLNCYVGQTEKNIRDAFEEAEETNSILLFDEADSFFANRESASRSWERTQVNEFLTQMEEFEGIVICTTNLRKIMDPAMQRRFHIITEFKALKEDGIRKLLSKYFSSHKFTEEQILELADYKTVTPGDFGALDGRFKFIPKEKIDSEYIFSELRKIQNEKRFNGSAKIGFAS